MKTVPVIMAGGAGTRLWPLSREEMPKQFHNLTGGGTLLSETINRLAPLNPETFLIATAKRYRDMSLDELKSAGADGTVLAEPRPRNTAAAVLYSAIFLSRLYKESIMIVLPADHYIKNRDAFIDVLRSAVSAAEKGALVTLGIKPSYPETGYGYIKSAESNSAVKKVDQFVEKPDMKTAEQYLRDGNYYWNSGIFVWKTSVIMDHFSKLMPGHCAAFKPLMEMSAGDIREDSDRVWEIKENIFNSLESISIDYGILEKAEDRLVIPCDIGWTDLGSWTSIDEVLAPDENSNRSPDTGKTITVSSKNCTVFSESKQVALVGVDNLVVVESGGSILVMDKNSSQLVREVVDIIKKK